MIQLVIPWCHHLYATPSKNIVMVQSPFYLFKGLRMKYVCNFCNHLIKYWHLYLSFIIVSINRSRIFSFLLSLYILKGLERDNCPKLCLIHIFQDHFTDIHFMWSDFELSLGVKRDYSGQISNGGVCLTDPSLSNVMSLLDSISSNFTNNLFNYSSIESILVSTISFDLLPYIWQNYRI